jgi:hypothetical protein
MERRTTGNETTTTSDDDDVDVLRASIPFLQKALRLLFTFTRHGFQGQNSSTGAGHESSGHERFEDLRI